MKQAFSFLTTDTQTLRGLYIPENRAWQEEISTRIPQTSGTPWTVFLPLCTWYIRKCCCLLSIDTESSLFFFVPVCLTLGSVLSVRARSICPDPLPHRLLWGILRPLLLRLLVSSTLCLCLFWHADVCKITDAVWKLQVTTWTSCKCSKSVTGAAICVARRAVLLHLCW